MKNLTLRHLLYSRKTHIVTAAAAAATTAAFGKHQLVINEAINNGDVQQLCLPHWL